MDVMIQLRPTSLNGIITATHSFGKRGEEVENPEAGETD